MNRIDGLPEGNLTSSIQKMRTSIDDLKQAQRTGTTALKIFLNQSASDYDKTFVIGSTTLSASFAVTFTAAVEDYAIASLIFQVFIGSPTAEFHPNGPGGTPAYPLITIEERPANTGARRATVWDMKVLTNDFTNENYYLKFFVQSTDSGVIAVS